MRFLQCFARAVVTKNLRALSGAVPLGSTLLEIVNDTWESYRVGEYGADTPLEARFTAEIQALAQAPVEEVKRLAATTAQEAADGQPMEVQQNLGRFLTQVPAMIRRSLRRPGDPAGVTVPGNLSFHSADDLLPLVPSRL